ncbi:MAG: hypothetical protein K8S97_16345 [Anaerolineae bacterium]|nr:hypothetical protein [Anaerolineae bacterium]
MAKLAGDHVQVLTDGYDLTGDSNRVTINDMRDVYDVTAFRDGVHIFIGGQRVIGLEHAGYLNADTARSHPVLRSGSLDGILSVLLGQNADPVTGDPMYSVPVQQGRYVPTPAMGSVVPFIARFANQGDLGGWGVALSPPVEFTNSITGTAVNNGAATANGGAAFLHILQAAASDTYSLIIEGSATGAFAGEETTVATLTLDGSALGSERVAISGTIPQYTRWKATRSGAAGDTVEVAINLVRH